MYKKVLYNNKKIKKNVGGGGGAIIKPKTPSMYLKKKSKKKNKKNWPSRISPGVKSGRPILSPGKKLTSQFPPVSFSPLCDFFLFSAI